MPALRPINVREKAFVESFVNPSRRERFLAALTDPKKRNVFHRELQHLKPSFLLEKVMQRVRPDQQRPEALMAYLHRQGAPETAWVFGNEFDGRLMKLDEALKQIVGYGAGVVVSCLPGTLAYVETEDERFLLRKP